MRALLWRARPGLAVSEVNGRTPMELTESLELLIVFGSIIFSIGLLVIIDRIGTIRVPPEEEEEEI